MENPATWGPVERTIDEVLKDAYASRRLGMTGLSLARKITQALERQDMLRPGCNPLPEVTPPRVIVIQSEGMSMEERVRGFAEKHIPNAGEYLSKQGVPAFNGLTWEEVFAGKRTPAGGIVSEQRQKVVFKRIQDIFGSGRTWESP